MTDLKRIIFFLSSLLVCLSGCTTTTLPRSDSNTPVVYWKVIQIGNIQNTHIYPANTNGPVTVRVLNGQPGYMVFLEATDPGGVQSISMNLLPASFHGASTVPDSHGQLFTSPDPLPLVLQYSQQFQQSYVFAPIAPNNQVYTEAFLFLAGFNWSCGVHQYGNMPTAQEFFAGQGTATITGTATNYFGKSATATITLSPS